MNSLVKQPAPDAQENRVASLPGVDAEARRLRMREFQAHLQNRLANVRNVEQKTEAHLGILIGSQRFLVDIREAGEIFSLQKITPVPLTQDWYLGLVNLRGVLTNVVDIVRFWGGPATAVERDSRVVTFGQGLGLNAGLLVSRVLGLQDARTMHVSDESAASPVSACQLPGKVLADDAGQSWIQIELAALIHDPRFLEVGVS